MDTGNLGFERPRPAEPEPVAPPVPEPIAPAEPWGPDPGQYESTYESYAEPASSADGKNEADEPWGTPYRGSHQAPRAAPEPERSSWAEPEAVKEPWREPATDWDQPAPQAGQQPEQPWAQGWNTPAESSPEPTHAWNSPDTGDQPSWGTPVEPAPADEPHEPWGTPVEPKPAQESWSSPAEPQPSQESWRTPDTGDQPSWGRPTEAQAPWGTPVEPQPSQDSWGAPSGAQAPQESWNNPVEPQPSQESWNNPGTGPQQGWAQTAQSYGEQGYGGQGYETQGYETQRHESAGATPEAWETPYAGQPAYQGDTPYPGSAPEPPSGSDPQDRPQERENRSDSYEFLYGGPHGSGGQGGPGGHEGPGGPGGPGGPYGPDDPYDDDDDAYDPGPPPRKKSRRGLIIGVAATVIVLALVGGAAGWYVYTLPQPEEATSEYEAAWEDQNYARLAAVTTGDDAEEILGGIDTGLGVDGVEVEIGAITTDGSTGIAPYEVTLSLANASGWGWEGELPLVREDGEWLVDFSPEVAYPELGEGQVLARTAVWGERGQILAADGTRLDAPDVSGSIQMIVGSLGEADDDDVERLGPAYSVGDTVGASGLQRTYEEHLAGEAATTILMVDAAEAEDSDSLEATEENTLATLDGSDGESITTSFDMNVQSAAANAIIDADDPAGLVAIRPSTGEVLAAVNVPGGFNRAFEGQYPPGSSFKVVTYSSLLDNGLSVDATMDCPEEYDLGGWPFRNAGGAEYGAQSVSEAFATSCNTALVHEIGQHLSPETLQASAEQFGMNAPIDLGVTTHEPSFPPVDSTTMMGAQGIGQGQVLTSPLHMATVPAAVADGSWRHPVLVTEPAREDLPEPNAIGNAEALRPMMRAVITEGTAEDAGFEGEVFGKTGSAEFGTADDADEDDELPTHAWMVGYKGDVAFAVVVEGGGGGGSVAGPLAAKFTNAL